MKILHDCNTSINKYTAVALGNFDGFHLGHQYLIKEMMKNAEEKGLTKSVFTFNNESLVNFKTNKTNNLLMSNEQKILLFEKIGIEILYLTDFTKEIMRMSPYDFVKKILVDQLHAKFVVIGFDYKFGHKAQGNGDFLIKAGKEFGFEVMIIDPITSNNKIISSSNIRELIKDGLIEEANILLGRPFAINGTIVKGKGRGKGLGFATANLKTDTKYQIPKFGVYKSITSIDNREFLSITNIGSNPTFNDVDFSIETHILNFNENIYGKRVHIQLLEFIREEKKFSNKNELVKQVMRDIEKISILDR
ncbi:riboflavin kinase / FMN adenylyltransferase [Proteiniborus sp. DW1]|uniref:bifunctional riboflavin kinase/FAD synthetase n=1 Tax=Proteiniborus sp. DW1 TaxID=1889883 RepID=UPI00092E0964|nr:bifunctional riboflavin kinase/FAD synthetase [Proteiniborus sp. DW1]SCG83399.1 riboflavin kinase / FMN adenylyltransferase [Proteiniborus sp. DW1]